MKAPRLSVTGTMTNGGNPNEKFDWADAIMDALILSGIGFFAALGGASAAGIPTKEAIVGALIAAGAQFLTILGLKRNLIKEG